MVYSPEEKIRMDCLLEAFGDYLAGSGEIDVAYSEKTGFVELVVEEGADHLFFPIKSFDDMLQFFFYSVLSEEVSLAEERNPDLTNATMDYSVPYERLRAIVATMDADRDYALGKLEEFIDYWKRQNLLP